jgi:cell division protein FtsN
MENNMSRDYKPAPPKPEKQSNPFVSGLLVGLLVGVAIAVAFTVYIKGGASAFTTKNDQVVTVEPTTPAEIKKGDNTDAKSDAAGGKDRFEFYNILPGNESKVTEQEMKQLQDDSKPKEAYYLQVGAYQTVQEADNMKAKLALLGLEAIVQTVSIPEKGVLHRVRVGPFTDGTQISKAKSDLTENGFKTDLIKVSAGQ